MGPGTCHGRGSPFYRVGSLRAYNRSVLDLGQFEGCPAVARGRPWLRGYPGPRAGRGRASSLPAEFCREAASLEAASLESIVSKLQQGKMGMGFLFTFHSMQTPSLYGSNNQEGP